VSLWRPSSPNQKEKLRSGGKAAPESAHSNLIDSIAELAREQLVDTFSEEATSSDVTQAVKTFTKESLEKQRLKLNVLEQRNLVSELSKIIWGEVEERRKTKAPIQNDIEQVSSKKNSDPSEENIPNVTQIPEEGITVFGADLSAPTEVTADFDQPDEWKPHASSDELDDYEQEITEPVVPQSNGTAEPEPENNTDLQRLEAFVDNSSPRSASQAEQIKGKVQPLLMERIDISAAVTMDRLDLARDISDIVSDILIDERIQLNQREQRELIEGLMHDMLGLGPLEPLLADDTITDIMVNGPKQVYVEQKGKLVLSDCQFRDNAHVLSIAGRIVSHVGRRVDESTPLVDARLADGSRVNIIIPPLAIDGPSISIRKFAKQKITLDVMERQGNLSPEAATVLRVAGRCRLNILISGGTGSGKTTMLNAISQLIDPGERIVTIEDAAELQMQQPHVVRLETRTANLEGGGEISMRDLLKNSLRMRPDRIILGEIRGGEAIDMLQAMNTGHDGSLSTVHANRPREALTRLENMVGMSGVNLPAKATRSQIASAIDLIVQVSRMRDGVRRVTYISEVVGMEEDVITMQDLFWYEYKGEDKGGRLLGEFKSSGLRPHFAPRAAYFGLDKMLIGAM